MSNSTLLARRFRVDVDTAYPGAASWAQLIGMTEFMPKVDPTMQEDNDYDSDGWGSSEKTMQKWSIEATFFRKADDVSGAYPPAQETLRLAEDQFGTAAHVHVRWYDKAGGAEAYEGVGTVTYERANSGVTDLDAAKVTITGRGARTLITNPLA